MRVGRRLEGGPAAPLDATRPLLAVDDRESARSRWPCAREASRVPDDERGTSDQEQRRRWHIDGIAAGSPVYLGSISGRSRVDLGSISGRSRVDLGSIAARSRVDHGWISARPSRSRLDVDWMLTRSRVDLGSISALSRLCAWSSWRHHVRAILPRGLSVPFLRNSFRKASHRSARGWVVRRGRRRRFDGCARQRTVIVPRRLDRRLAEVLRAARVVKIAPAHLVRGEGDEELGDAVHLRHRDVR